MSDTDERIISGLTITILRSECIGSANCTKIAPEVFELGYDGIVRFCDDAPDIDQDRLIEACDICPVDALRWSRR